MTDSNPILTGVGRDAQKRFRIREVLPLYMAGFALRLLSALKLPDWSALSVLIQPQAESSDEALNVILAAFRGCDPVAVHALVCESLGYVDIAPDPKHPEAWRLVMPADIEELRTLGNILATFVRLNFALDV